MPLTRPMKGEDLEDSKLDSISFPVIVSPKLDGIRSIKVSGKMVSSTFKPIANVHIRSLLEMALPNGADGEIISGPTFQSTTSAVMTQEGEPEFTFWVFDLVNPENLEERYVDRLVQLHQWFNASERLNVKIVPTWIVFNLEEFLEREKLFLSLGYEGMMVRSLDGFYKCGRATLKQQWLFKRKPFEDSEAKIIGFVEQRTNTNRMETNELGLSKRSSSKSGKVRAGTLGKFLAVDIHGKFPDVVLRIGTGKGLTKDLRQNIWDDQASYMGRTIVYKFQRVGVKDAPRLPIYKGFRDPRDIEYDYTA